MKAAKVNITTEDKSHICVSDLPAGSVFKTHNNGEAIFWCISTGFGVRRVIVLATGAEAATVSSSDVVSRVYNTLDIKVS